MNSLVGVAADLLVAVLLAATIVTSLRLSRRIRALKADEQTMRGTIAELVAATDSAERAVSSLRRTLGECERTLGERLRQARACDTDLEGRLRSAQTVFERVDSIAALFRRASEPAESDRTASGRAASLQSAGQAVEALLQRNARRSEERAA